MGTICNPSFLILYLKQDHTQLYSKDIKFPFCWKIQITKFLLHSDGYNFKTLEHNSIVNATI